MSTGSFQIPFSTPPYAALYLHIPFCQSRCSYCSFTTEAIEATSWQVDAYIDELCASIRDAESRGLFAAIETVYIGGGTPSYLGQERLRRLLGTLSDALQGELADQAGAAGSTGQTSSGDPANPVAPANPATPPQPLKEWTIEANPESMVSLDLSELKSLGVTRISLGVQSLNDSELQTLGRIHDAATARQAIVQVQESGLDLSIDLICGIPGQDVDSWLETLSSLATLKLDHLSVYPLSIDEGTELQRLMEEPGFDALMLPDEDDQAEDLLLAEEYLKALGLLRYEVASYARPGHEALHNLAYWTAKPYLGLGRGAAGMAMLTAPDGAARRIRFMNGEVEDELFGPEIAAEDLMLRMRLAAGVSEPDLEAFSQALPKAPAAMAKLISEGLVEKRKGRYRPTQRGWLLSNRIFTAMLELAEA